MENSDAKRLAAAAILLAVDDWKRLCKGKAETDTISFVELEEFFDKTLDTYLTGTSIRAEDIREKMQRLRANASFSKIR